jgi:hypothetical protein
MTIANQYTLMGALTIIPAADIADDASAANVRSAARLGDAGIGKSAGMLALRDNGSGDYDIVIATGAGATDPWLLFEAGTAVTPS